jgi:hypothetical protein
MIAAPDQEPRERVPSLACGIALIVAFIAGYVVGCFVSLPLPDSDDASPPVAQAGVPTFTYDENGRHCIGFTHDAMGWREIIPDDLDNMESDAQPLEHCSLQGGGR